MIVNVSGVSVTRQELTEMRYISSFCFNLSHFLHFIPRTKHYFLMQNSRREEKEAGEKRPEPADKIESCCQKVNNTNNMRWWSKAKIKTSCYSSEVNLSMSLRQLPATKFWPVLSCRRSRDSRASATSLATRLSGSVGSIVQELCSLPLFGSPAAAGAGRGGSRAVVAALLRFSWPGALAAW